jgi:hypothetical protein
MCKDLIWNTASDPTSEPATDCHKIHASSADRSEIVRSCKCVPEPSGKPRETHKSLQSSSQSDEIQDITEKEKI